MNAICWISLHKADISSIFQSSLRDQPEFRVSDFERFVDTIREAASRHLHSLVLERADLKGELQMARDFFLLGRGELFQTFIEQADIYLQKPVMATTQHGNNGAFAIYCTYITWTSPLFHHTHVFLF